MSIEQGKHIASEVLANDEDVQRVLEAPEYHNGRGAFRWATFDDGSVCLMVYPQGALFEELLQKGAFQ